MSNNNKPTTSQYGIITEQGDLGLGFNVLTEAEQKTVEETEDKKKSK